MPPRQVNRVGRPNFDRRPPRRSKPRRDISIPSSWIRLAGVGVAILVLLVVISRWTALKSISVSGNTALPKERVTALANDGLHKQIFGRNTVLADTGTLANYLEQAEPALKDVAIERSLPGRLKIKVVERQPGLNWRTGDTTYLLDVDGTVIAPTKGIYSRLPVVIDASNVPVKPGKSAVSSAFVSFCNEFLNGLTTKTGLKAGESSVSQSTSELYVKTDKGFLLKVDTTRPAGEELGDLAAVMSELARSRKSPSEYIDLRVEHKAYYK
ncbi:MAG TPA: FtsQ-type POTRA domain-containing protein [Candidatus Saccharimonadales bacterium]|nr:FtsQ-type POTRA domain-containing protein [Candidatus Saccharimonadales bacterium]